MHLKGLAKGAKKGKGADFWQSGTGGSSVLMKRKYIRERENMIVGKDGNRNQDQIRKIHQHQVQGNTF